MLKYVTFSKTQRILLVSDIHANLQLLKKALEDHFSNQTELFILGDFLQKGPDNLNILKYIYELSKQKNVHILKGNCDRFFENVDYQNEDSCARFFRYIKDTQGTNTIFNDLLKEFNLNINENFIMKDFFKRINDVYGHLIQFIKTLPTIIETDKFILAHAGLEPNDNYRNTSDEYALKHDDQNKINYRFDKLLIVGHWTSQMYNEYVDSSPYYSKEHNILFIDGANQVNITGQLNLVELVNANPISYINYPYDNLVKICVQTSQNYEIFDKKHPVKIIWPQNGGTLIEEKEETIICRVEYLSSRGDHSKDPFEVEIFKEFFDREKGVILTHTNIFLELIKGEKISLIYKGKNVSIIKKNGVVGLAYNKNLILV